MSDKNILTACPKCCSQMVVSSWQDLDPNQYSKYIAMECSNCGYPAIFEKIDNKSNPNCEDCKGTGEIEVQQLRSMSHFQAIYEPVGPYFKSKCHCVGEIENA